MAGKGSIVFGSDVTGLKKATSELLKMADEAKRTGAALAYADKEELAFNQSLGSMATVAKSVSGKMSELSTSIKELTVHYRSLSDQEKSSPYGKTLQASIQQLQGRFRELKGGVDEAAKGMQTGGGVVDKLTSVLGAGSSTLLKFAGGFGAAMSAGEAFNRIIGASQTTSDYWDQVMRSCSNTVNVFATSIATMDFSVMNQGLSVLVDKAFAAMAAIDQLENTLLSYNAVKGRLDPEIAKARAVYYDPNSTKDEKQGAYKTLQNASQQMQTAAGIAAKDIASQIKTSIAEVSVLAADEIDMGLARKMVELDVTSGRDKNKDKYSKQYKQFLAKQSALDKQKNQTYTSVSGYQYTKSGMSNADYKKKSADLRKTYQESILFNDILVRQSTEWLNGLGQQFSKMDSMAAEAETGFMSVAGRLMQRLNNSTNSSTKGTKGSRSKASAPKIKWDTLLDTGDWEGIGDGYNIPLTFTIDTPDLSSVDAQIRLLQERMQHTTSPTTYSQLNQRSEVLKTYAERFKSGQLDEKGIYNPLQSFEGVKPVIAPQNARKGDEGDDRNKDKKERKNEHKVTDGLSEIGSSVQQLYQAFGATVPEGLQRVLSTLSVISAICGTIQGILVVLKALGIVDASTKWIPFLADGGYIPKFAGGGTVGGTSYAGDHILARLNSGEAVLNSEQAGNILTQLADSKGNGGGGGVFVLRGEDIYTSMNNFGKRTGRGELVFSRR